MITTVPERPVHAPDSPLDWGTPLVPGEIVRDDRIAPRAPWSAVVAAGDVLTIVDVGGNQSADCLIFDAADTDERYSVPDTLTWQGNAYVREGTVLRSNLGGALMTVVGNEVERQDTIGGACSKESNTLRYGHHTAYQHACRENFLAEAARHGHGRPRPRLEPELVHERARRGRRGPRHRRRDVGAGPPGRAAGGPRRARDRLELPPDEQSLQRLQLHAAAHDRDARVTGFDTLLVANRGEIARRIIRSAREIGMRTVAVYSDADRAAPHVREADDAVRLGPAPARESYLRVDALLEAAASSGAGAVHPGYGFVAENVDAARAFESAGVVWVGPTPDQLAAFGLKHTARALAEAAGVPLLAGSGLLADADEAAEAAASIGYPVMLKATGGGGGIGMRVCRDEAEVRDGFYAVARQAAASFGSSGVFLERLIRPARHVEVQVFGDGAGRIAVLGDRDCTLQRRNQKVIEEAPAFGLPTHVRAVMHDSARRLAASIDYRSAGTVEFIYDPLRHEASFLEVNTRLQVEHPVTEAVLGIDLVALMLRLARDGAGSLERDLFEKTWVPRGHAFEARIYAEDPDRDCAPSTGFVTQVRLPDHGTDSGIVGVRVDGWIEAGIEVTSFYDPLLAKVITHADTREAALDLLGEALGASRIDGIVSGIGMLRALTASPVVRTGQHSTTTLAETSDPDPRIDVLTPGIMTTVQDLPARLGYWQVGVPPSGPMDAVSFREANLAVGNLPGAPGLEITLQGPQLRFSVATVICVTGAPADVSVDGAPVPMWEPIAIPAGGILAIGRADGPGLRLFLAVAGGIDVPAYLGSASTFTLGGFGGHGGRALAAGDVLRVGAVIGAGVPAPTPGERRPHLTSEWVIAVTEGPHAAPDFFTRADIDEIYSSRYEVHLNSARTGVRLSGPKPSWARDRRRRGRTAPLQHPRHPLRRGGAGLHRGHPDPARPGRSEPRRIRVPGRRRQR